MLPTINAIWIGREMGPVHAACLMSFLATDHKVILHTYGEVSDAPRGVSYADAGVLLPEHLIQRHRQTGSLALASDFMRYEILQRGLGLYVDCDVFCLRPFEDREYIFGWERHNSINGAVLQAPPDSPLLQSLQSIGRRGWVAPWPSRRRPLYRLLAAIGLPVGAERLPWGWAGPRALSWYVNEHGLDDQAQPIDVFHPLDLNQTPLLYDPELQIEDLVTRRTRYIHLFNDSTKKSRPSAWPANCPIDQLLKRARATAA